MKSLLTVVCLITLILVVGMPSHSQPVSSRYKAQWKKVEEFQKKSLPASALKEVKNIYALAKKDKQEVHVIRALVYMTLLQEENRENNDVLSITEWEKEVPQLNAPARYIAASLLAGMYENYTSAHRWQFYDRTKVNDESAYKKEDISTWPLDALYQRTGEWYQRSVADEKLLQRTPLAPFDDLIIKGNMRHLRPTLYDLLVFRELDYFSNDDRNLDKPAYAFQLDQAAAFDPAVDFVHRKFPTRDSASLHHQALLLYQRLIAFHLNDPKPDALIDADLARLAFVKQYSVHPDKEELYRLSVNHIASQYGNLPAAAQAWYLVAAAYREKGDTYKPFGDTTHRYDLVKAKEICEKVLAQKDSSEGKVNCTRLLSELTKPDLQSDMERVNVPDQPFRSRVAYKNVNRIFLRLIKPDEALKKQLENRYDEKFWTALLAARSEKSWEQELPAMTDLQTHAAEIRIDALPPGDYVLLTSTEKSFGGKKAVIAYHRFYVSSISYVNEQRQFFVLHRETGKPLSGATVLLWQRKYDYKTSKYILEKSKLYTADDNGHIMIDSNLLKNYQSFYPDIIYAGERLYMPEEEMNIYYYGNRANNVATADPESRTSTYLFTDRKLYRPGQTVYFKGIVVMSEGKKRSIRPGYKTWMSLWDANGQKIDSVQVTTNDYGSFAGNFHLPAGTLNGAFRIEEGLHRGQTFVHVEEYKRPKFYVEFEPVKGSYRVNDTVTVKGVAKAYAGNTIDGAQVKYRVVREPRFIYPWLFRKWWLPPTSPMEITHGEMVTAADGSFTVKFAAVPDRAIDKRFEPLFDYRVYADVTDINGETRSGEKAVTAGYKGLTLQTVIPETIEADSLRQFGLRTENLNGQFEPASVKVSISRLQEEKRLIRPRYWERPDQFVMSREEYIKNFPYDEYANETDIESWARLGVVFEKSDSSNEKGVLDLRGADLKPGFYIAEFSTIDTHGDTIVSKDFFEITDPENKQLQRPEFIRVKAAEPTEPGQTAEVQLGTGAADVQVIQLTQKQDKDEPVITSFRLSEEKKKITFPVTEEDRGGFGVSFIWVKHNRFYQHTQTIAVPWTNKELEVEYTSFRDKTLPGSEEKWTLRLKGPKQEKVAAEILASMYDASLDQFYPHSWFKPSVWPYYARSFYWTSNANFQKRSAYIRPVLGVFPGLDKRYDALFPDYNDISFQHDMNPDIRYRGNAEVVFLAAAPAAKSVANSYNADVMGDWSDTGRADADGEKDEYEKKEEIEGTPATQDPAIQVRKNFNETAFFFPQLLTDKDGSLTFSFTLPEALTRWKFQALTHTRDLAFGYSSKEIVTQKQLMVQPNMPRFVRENDKMQWVVKVANLSERPLTGTAELTLLNAATGEPVNTTFKLSQPRVDFSVPAGQSVPLSFAIEIPAGYSEALQWRVVAKAGDYSDGEENILPVLSNRMLVTESVPLLIKGNGTKEYRFEKLLASGKSNTLRHEGVTVEFTSNPAWFAVQALPYMLDYPYECAEQTWNRYYANALATMVANSTPRIREVYKKWNTQDTASLFSNLQKNEELKSLLLAETPWVAEAKTEAEQKKRIALLFDMAHMSSLLNTSYEKLRQMQAENGAFVWFKGGPDDWYMTQYIISGIGHLRKLGGIANGQESALQQITNAALPWLDKKLKTQYDELKKSKTDLASYVPGSLEIQYLYMRSFFPERKIPAATQPAYNYFRTRALQTWTKQTRYLQGMLALALHRSHDTKTPTAILQSLKETAVTSEDLGMYWKDARRGWFWHEAPLERQALMVEAFQEIAGDEKTVTDLRTWLLMNKQTNNWESTRATAEACYALLLGGKDWLSENAGVSIQLGNTAINTAKSDADATGYVKERIDGAGVKPDMGNISVTVSGKKTAAPAWGAVYWQYFEDMDKITVASTPLSLEKKIFVETNTDRGPVLQPVAAGSALKTGSKIVVRIVLRADRDMEYVHMKDTRASGTEPVNVLSSYKWQDGLGYYETTRDASTNFFFDHLRKGTYVFEYPLFVTHTGDFSNGVATIQCMYAPEFAAHSEGIRIQVK